MTAGHPRSFTSVKQLQKGIDAYLEDCKANDRPLSVSGLASDLGVCRETVFEYQKGTYGDEYSNPIKKVVQQIESAHAEGLLSGKLNTTGAIFTLKNNHGWKDQQHIEQTGESTQRLIVSVEDDEAMDDELENEY